MNQLKAGALLSYVALGLSNVIGLLYTPYMLRMMGQSEYGLYSLVASVVAYLTVLDFGFGSAIVRYTAKFRAEGKVEEQYSLFGMFVLLYSAIGVVSFLVGLGLYFNVDRIFGDSMTAEELDKARVMMLLLIFNVSVTFPLSIFGSIITAYENFIFQKVVNIVRIILNPIAMIIMLMMGYKAIGMVMITTAFNIATLLINWWYCKHKTHVKIHFGNYDLSLLREIATFSMFIFLKLILDKVYWSTGQFVLGAVSGTVAVAVYAVAMQLKNYYLAFSTSMMGVFLPRLTAMVANKATKKEISDLFIRIGRLQFHIVGFVLCGFILFGKAFIQFWAGPDYTEAYTIALIVFIPFTVPLIQTLGHPLVQALNQQKFQFCVYVVVALLTLVFSVLFAREYGGIGCAIALAIAIAVGEIGMMNWFYAKRVGIDIMRFWSEMIKIALSMSILITCGFLQLHIQPISGIVSLVLHIGVFCTYYLLLIYFTAFTSTEKALICSVFFKLFRFKTLQKY